MKNSKSMRTIDLMIKTSLLPITQVEYFGVDILGLNEPDRKDYIYKSLNNHMNIDNLDEINLFWDLFYNKRKLSKIKKLEDKYKSLISRRNIDKSLDVKLIYKNNIKYQHNNYIIDLLTQFSETFISQRDSRLVFKYWETEKNKYFKTYKGINKVLVWNSLNRYLATDILGVLYLINNGVKNEEYLQDYYSNIALEDMQLEKVLKKGLAETHLHASASRDFYSTWQNLMSPYNKNAKIGLLDKVQVISNKNKSLKMLVRIASIYRMLMAYYIKNKNKMPNNLCFGCFIENIYYKNFEKPCSKYESNPNKESFKEINNKNVCDYENADCIVDIYYKKPKLRMFLEKLAKIDYSNIEKFSLDELDGFYKIIFEDILGLRKKRIDNKKSESSKDIIDFILFEQDDDYNSNIKTYSENIFLFRLINFLKKTQKKKLCEDWQFLKESSLTKSEICNLVHGDYLLSEFFVNYLKIKNEVFTLLVQGNQIKGLLNFQNYFKRSTKISRLEDELDMWEYRFRYLLKDENLRKLEIRIAPPSAKDNKKKLRNQSNIKDDMKKELKKIFESYLKAIAHYMDFDYEKVKNLVEQKDKYPNSNYDSYTNDDIRFLRTKIRRNIPKLSIIYHFIKSDDSKVDKKCYIEYEKEYQRENLYFEEHRTIYDMQAKAIVELRKDITNLSYYIVGFDAASIEDYTDPWVFAPIYEDVRDSKRFMFDKNHKKMQSLNFTFHAGEDFRHILTGLRRIDESIKFYKYHAGDRIGHAIALGLNLDYWQKKHPIVIMPKIEYLENLVWLWGLCKYKDTIIDLGYLERKIMDICKDIYMNTEGITIYLLWEVYEAKFQTTNDFINNIKQKKDCILNGLRENNNDLDETVDDIDFDIWDENCKSRCFQEHSSNDSKDMKRPCFRWDKEKLKLAYHCKVILNRMREPMNVEVPRDKIDILKEIQEIIRNKVSNSGIIVETNPSSNTALGEIESIFNHYITSLNKIDTIKNHDSLMISINTDDPSVFNTNLSNEFAYIFYSLVEKGYSKEKVLKWIDKIRQHGMDSSFIKDDSDIDENYIIEIIRIINDLNGY